MCSSDLEISKIALQAPYFNNYKPVENKAWYNFKKRIKKDGLANQNELEITNDIQFYEKLSETMRNGDKSSIPEIDQLAKIARQEIFQKLGKEAVNVGLLDEKILTTPPKTAISYFPRLWNKLKVIGKENELRSFLFNKIKTDLLPKIKQAEANKELNLNSQILFYQTRADQLTNYLEEFEIKKNQKPTIIEEEKLIPKEYKEIFQDAILQSKNGGSYEDFVDLLQEQLPDSFDFPEEKIKNIYDNYVLKDQSIYDIDEMTRLVNQFKSANKTLGKDRGKSLLVFLRDRGGIIDRGGELKNMGITHKTLPALIRKEKTVGGLFFNGQTSNYQTLGSAMEAAFEEGY